MTADLLPPPAFLGFKPDLNTGKVLVRVCAYCASKKEAEQEAARLKCEVTHGICPACYQAQIGARYGD